MRDAPTLVALTSFVCSRDVSAADVVALAARTPALEVLSVDVSQLLPIHVRRGLPPASTFPRLRTFRRIKPAEACLTGPRDRAEGDGAAGVGALLEGRRLRVTGTMAWLMDPWEPPFCGIVPVARAWSAHCFCGRGHDETILVVFMAADNTFCPSPKKRAL